VLKSKYNFTKCKVKGGFEQMARNWLREMRLSKNKTMKQVASEAEVSECYYCQIESGARNVSINVAKKIALVLGFAWTKFFE
jgi:transcriptional regulator with XRE-family HTH domain